ncbi:hypothetical protein EGW08_009434 [Elysia chlorotica]|uniref:Uncharacterized protein n=1 Tax=Elysia chlorotica TaxID=188477 RepID=A0A433TMM5_ELYCH|nr:hypothetical protein EGW08_009434 [Elysia chlorotica]
MFYLRVTAPQGEIYIPRSMEISIPSPTTLKFPLFLSSTLRTGSSSHDSASCQRKARCPTSSDTLWFSGCSLIRYKDDTWYNCAGTRRFRSSRERWWYIAVARCGSPKDRVTGLYIEYKIHMTNGDDYLHQEFSVDEFYILPVDVIFLLTYLIICTISIVFATKLKRRQLLHATYKLYLAALFIWTAHLVLMVAAWARYGQTGVELTKVEVTGRILQRASTTVLVLMLILMGKGYTITRGRLPRATVGKIATFITFYSVTIVALFIWEGEFFDSGKVLYYYESPPGYGIIAIHLIGWIWFLQSTIFTLKHAQKKSGFYIPFFSFYTLWFLSGPGVVLIAMFAMAKWSREKSVNGVEQFVTFLGHCFFLIAILGEGEYPGAGNPYILSSDIELPELDKKGNSKKQKDKGKRAERKLSSPRTQINMVPNLQYPSLFPSVQKMSNTASTSSEANIVNNGNNNNYNNNNNSNILSANHLFSHNMSIMTRRGQSTSNPLPAIGEVNALSSNHDPHNGNSLLAYQSENPLSPRATIAWGHQPGVRSQLPPLRSAPQVTGGGFSVSSSPCPSVPNYDLFQAKSEEGDNASG